VPMIDAYAAAGTFAGKHLLAVDLAAAVMTIERVPDIPMFRQNTAAFIHDLPAGSLSNVDGDASYVRIQVLTNAGALNCGKQLAVVDRLTSIAAGGGNHIGERRFGLGVVACDQDGSGRFAGGAGGKGAAKVGVERPEDPRSAAARRRSLRPRSCRRGR
jgi:hypothetical protein